MSFDDQLARAARIARRAVRLRCPRCGEAPLFRGWFTMEAVCRFCGFRYERAQGYFVGAIYINYGVSVIIAVGGYFLLWSRTDISTTAQFAIWVPFLLVFPLWFFRYSRSFWLALEYFVNPEQ